MCVVIVVASFWCSGPVDPEAGLCGGACIKPSTLQGYLAHEKPPPPMTLQ